MEMNLKVGSSQRYLSSGGCRLVDDHLENAKRHCPCRTPFPSSYPSLLFTFSVTSQPNPVDTGSFNLIASMAVSAGLCIIVGGLGISLKPRAQ